MKRGPKFQIIIFLFLSAQLTAFARPATTGQDRKAIKEWQKILKNTPLPQENTELELKQIIGKEGQIGPQAFLRFLWGIVSDKKENFYVSDWGGDKIVKFKMNGSFLCSFGKTGQGPGDLFRPATIMLNNDQIIVHDYGNRRVVYFDEEGKYLRHFKLYRNYFEMAISPEGQFFAIPFFIKEKKNSQIIDILDGEGNLVRSFGTYPKIIPRLREAWGHISIDPQCGEVYLAYSHFLIVQKYSSEGRPLGEYRISHPFMRLKEKENIVKLNRVANPALFQVIDAIEAVEDGFFLLITYPRTEFLHFDRKGLFLMDYWYSSSWDAGAAKNFIVKNNDLDRKTFVLFYEQRYPSILILEKRR